MEFTDQNVSGKLWNRKEREVTLHGSCMERCAGANTAASACRPVEGHTWRIISAGRTAMMTSANTSEKSSRYADELSVDAVLVGEEPVGVGGAHAWRGRRATILKTRAGRTC